MPSVLNRIAYLQGRRGEVPNQALARELAASKNENGIGEIAQNLWNKDKNIRSDCIKVLYEIGYIEPRLIADYVDSFLKLLESKNNRLVWGAMIALGTIADQRPREIWQSLDTVLDAIERGSVITIDWGIRTLAAVAIKDREYRDKIAPILFDHLKKCIPRDVPARAESILRAVDAANKEEFIAVLNARLSELSGAQLARLKKVLRGVERI